jgi:hypothetical protein
VDAGVLGACSVVPELGELVPVPVSISPLAVVTGEIVALVEAVDDVAGLGPPSAQLATASASKMGASARAPCFIHPSSTRPPDTQWPGGAKPVDRRPEPSEQVAAPTWTSARGMT